MKNSSNGKIRLVSAIAVCTLFLLVGFSSASGEVLSKNAVSDDTSFVPLDSEIRNYRPLKFPLLFYKIFNNDWNYWDNPPHMYAIPEGNVGIGVTDPYNKLEVSSDSGDCTIYAQATSTGENSLAGWFYSYSQCGTGVKGEGGWNGVYGYSWYNNAVGVYGEAAGTDSAGVLGNSTGEDGAGVVGYGKRVGVVGSATDEGCLGVLGYAYGKDGIGVDALSVGEDGIGIYASGDRYAGQFWGDVDIKGTLSKSSGSFKIDHPLDPENKYLYHSFVESPDMMNIYNGNVILDTQGEAWLELPEWFEALNKEFRYQLTCIGGYAPVYISEEISNNHFRIAGGKPDMKVSWQVTGIRHDPYAEMYRIQVEEYKPSNEIGKYLHPETYGLPQEMDIDYIDK